MPKISLVVVSYNEATKLEKCLESAVKKVDEIVLVDMGSTDNSINIAKSFNAEVFTHTHVQVVEQIRNFAISKAKNDWVLVLDPDEQITENLIKVLKETVQNKSISAVNIPRKNIFFNKWIRHSNFWPDHQIRFFKKQSIVWDEKIHSYPKISGEIVKLDENPENAIIHYGYDSIENFITRLNRYTSKEKNSKNPIIEFGKRYFWHAGFLDGMHGLVVCTLMCIYYISVWVKIWEKKK